MVFPAHAGMSRNASNMPKVSKSFPRSRGDEPALLFSECEHIQFSPLTRG